MASNYANNGIACSIGFGGTAGGITITNPAISTYMILESADISADAENIEVFDESGNLTMSSWTNPQAKVSLKMTIKGTGLAQVDATVQTLLFGVAGVGGVQPGTLFIISACQKMPSLVATNWEAMSGLKLEGTNKTAKTYNISLRASPGITAVSQT